MSPRLLGRSDTDRYKQSLRICENAITLSHGNVIKRPGTRYLETSPTEGNIRLFDLQADLKEPFVVELGWRTATGGYLRLMDRDGYVQGSPQFVLNPSFLNQLDNWTDASDVNASVEWASPNAARFLPEADGGGRDAILNQQVTVTNGAVAHRCGSRAISNVAGTAMTLRIGTTAGASDIATAAITNGENFVTFTPGVATFWISYLAAGALEGSEILLDVSAIVEDTATVYEVPTPWSDADLPLISTALSTQQLALYFAAETQAPYRFIINAPGVYTFEPVPFVAPPAVWQPGNYPHAVTFYQQRLWYAATPLQPDTLWASQTNDFLNFALGTGLATESIAFEMSDRGVVQWLQGARDLLVGCDVAEYIVTSVGGIVIPGDIQIQQQSAYGGAHVEPVEVGNGVLYLGNDRRRIRFMSYQFLEDGWISVDLTWPSEHVTQPLVREIHFKYAPDPLIWCVLQDGTTISAVYEREQNNLVGWHRHPMPLGDVQSSALTKLAASTELWVGIRRVVEGVTVTYIERTEALSLDAGLISVLQDSAIVSNVEDGGDGNLYIRGLETLEGLTVQTTIEGAAHVDRVVESGQIIVQPGFGKVGQLAIVGIKIPAQIVTLPLEGLNKAGTALGMAKRRSRIFVRVLQSAIPVINGEQRPARFPIMPMDENPDNFTGDLQVADLGWDHTAEVTIDMGEARTYNVLAIFGDAEGNTL